MWFSFFSMEKRVFFVWVFLFCFFFSTSPQSHSSHRKDMQTCLWWLKCCSGWKTSMIATHNQWESSFFFLFFPLWSILPVFLGVNFFCRQSRIFNFDEIYYSSCKNVLCSPCTLWFTRQLCFIWFILFITIDFDVHKCRVFDSWAAIGYWIHPDRLLMLFLLIQESCWAHCKCSCRKKFPSALCEVR